MRKPYQNFKTATNLQGKLLSRYQQQLQLQQQLLLAVRDALPVNLGNEVNYSVWNENKVVLFTHSSVFATQLRFHTAKVISHLSSLKLFSQIEQIQIRLIPTDSKAEPLQRQAKIPSKETIQFLSSSVTSNNKSDVLQQALNNLSAALEKRANEQ